MELIDLYHKVNRQIIEADPKQSDNFVGVTNCLQQIKECLGQIEVRVTFRHDWFNTKVSVSYWEYFNKFNEETDNKSEASNVKRFFVKYKAPTIKKTPKNEEVIA